MILIRQEPYERALGSFWKATIYFEAALKHSNILRDSLYAWEKLHASENARQIHVEPSSLRYLSKYSPWRPWN